jgi:hypothetical protein
MRGEWPHPASLAHLAFIIFSRSQLVSDKRSQHTRKTRSSPRRLCSAWARAQVAATDGHRLARSPLQPAKEMIQILVSQSVAGSRHASWLVGSLAQHCRGHTLGAPKNTVSRATPGVTVSRASDSLCRRRWCLNPHENHERGGSACCELGTDSAAVRAAEPSCRSTGDSCVGGGYVLPA